MPKIMQMSLMQLAGVPVPKWEIIRPDHTLDDSEWGPLIIIKPGGGVLSSYARGVELKRTADVCYRPPAEFEALHRAQFDAVAPATPVGFRGMKKSTVTNELTRHAS